MKIKLIFLVFGLAVIVAGCTPKEKERVPGPLVVWIAADEGEEELMELRLIADDFTRETKIPIELVTKSSYDMQFSLLRHPEDLKGVDVVEVDYFDLDEVYDLMADIKPALEKMDGGNRFFTEAIAAGVLGGTQRFIPWRLTWPAMVAAPDYAAETSFIALANKAESDQVTIMLPALDDRDLFALLCAVAWSVNADPARPGDSMADAMDTIHKLARVVPMEASATGPGAAAELENRPQIMFDWPEGILALGTDVPLEMESVALPCGKTKCVPFSGRFLAAPETAPHRADAIAFIRFMLSPRAQSRIASSSMWLPVRTDGFSDLGGRSAPYQGIAGGSTMLRAMPQSAKVQNALVAAGRMILFENATAGQGLAEFNRRMQ